MNGKLRRMVIKCIAVGLTVALIGGLYQGYGQIDTQAQEKTLPGIEKLVNRYLESGETFHILEIVPDKSEASFGYLVGGEEPVADGRKLSEMPASVERITGMSELENRIAAGKLQSVVSENGPVTFRSYNETDGAREIEIRGEFVLKEDGSGNYNYTYRNAVYRMLQDGETASGERYDRLFTFEKNGEGTVETTVAFSKIREGLQYLEATLYEDSGLSIGYAADRYALMSDWKMSDVELENFDPNAYVEKDVYVLRDENYEYYGKMVWGSGLPQDYETVSDGDANVISTRIVSDGEGDVSDIRTVSDGNAEGARTLDADSDISSNLYIINPAAKTAWLWGKFSEDGYALSHLADGHFVEFATNENGDYYISRAVACENAPWKLTDSYRVNDNGRYVMESNGEAIVTYRGEEGFEERNTFDFIGDYSKTSLGTVKFNGGFHNKEWFKINVLNLSGNIAYDGSASDAELSDMKLEVATVDREELAELALHDTYCGISLNTVDFIYLSGNGNFEAEPAGMGEAALQLVKLAYGVKADGTVDVLTRVPVVMDYQFYSKNKARGNSVSEKLALLLLLSENETWVTRMAGASADIWDTFSTEELFSQVNQMIASEFGKSGISDVSLDGLKEYVAANVYLNNDTVSSYVSADYLTDFSDASMSGQHQSQIFEKVLQEIQYENFLLENNQAEGETELISTVLNKAVVTRYILNWSLRRITVKNSLHVLELEPCYDFKLNAAIVKDYMNMPEYAGNISITRMPSEEFIGKIEDLNEEYDMIYVGARTGTMNTENGYTVYNDARMNGLIYTHAGDFYRYSKESDEDKKRLKDDSLYTAKQEAGEENYYRVPGNDMNSTREEEFEQYIEAGYPVVFAKELLKDITGNVSVNETAVDCNSYFYKLIDFALSKDDQGNYRFWQKNVYAENQLTMYGGLLEESEVREKRQATFCNYLNLSKLNIRWVSDLGESYMPVEYDEDKEQTERYLKAVDGRYQMQFIFSLSNDEALSQVSTNYDCKLFIDTNSDGRFAGSAYSSRQQNNATEELGGLSLYVRRGDTWENVEQKETADGMRYELYTGNTYKLVRQLPDDYKGMLPWKLVFYDNMDRLVRTSMSGYTAVNRGTKEKIRVLQLMSDKDASGGKVNWDLADDSEVQNLLGQIDEFDVEITSKKVSDFLKEVAANSSIYEWEVWDGMEYSRRWNEKFFQRYYNAVHQEIFTYDMIILGFGDNYGFGKNPQTDYSDFAQQVGCAISNQAAAEAIRDYIEDGRSVLFTHDSSSYINTEDTADKSWYWGYDFNKVLRAAVGLDRYGALQYYYQQKVAESTTEAEKNRYQNYLKVLQEDYRYDTLYQPGVKEQALVQREGLTKFTVVRYLYKHLEELFEKRGGKLTSEGYSSYFPVNNELFYNALYKEGEAGKTLIGNYANYKSSSSDAGPSLVATMVNEGQITNYPFKISDDELRTLEVANTHYQWLQPNMELDRDHDGKNDIVVWYCLSDLSESAKKNKENYDGSTDNIYNICPNDVVNNYYIYSMGNVTYSGAGHTKPADGSAEKKLFVNTMVAAYSAGVKAPSVSFENEAGTAIGSVYMMYDPVNRIILNGQDKISVNFRATDYNILSGGTEIRVEFFVQCEDAADGALEVEGITGKVVSVPENKLTVISSAGEAVHKADQENEDFSGYFQGDVYSVQGGNAYELKLDTTALGLFLPAGEHIMLRDRTADTIYIRATTVYDNGTKRTESNVSSLTISAAELIELK